MFLGSVNSGPVPTGRPTVLGLVYHEIEILVVNGTNSAGNLWIKVYGIQWHEFCIYTRNKEKNIFKKLVDKDQGKD